MAKCPICGAPMESEKCEYCGYVEKPQPQPVAYGNKELSRDRQVEQTVQQQQIVITNQYMVSPGVIPGVSRKQRWVALFLCIFLGEFGVHRFYVGRVGSGILYLFTFGLFGIGWLVDIIQIAVGVFKDEFDLPLKN